MDMSGRSALERWWETSAVGRPTQPSPVNGAESRGVNPFMKAASRSAADTTALVTQRLRAAIAYPDRIRACRSPHELMTEQMRYWQQATDEYNSMLRNLQAACSPVLPGLAMLVIAAPTSMLPPPHTIPRTASAASDRVGNAAARVIDTIRDPAVPVSPYHQVDRYAA